MSGRIRTLAPVTRCTLCRRNLMAGERFRLWTPSGRRTVATAVCGLCESHARSEGWSRENGPAARESAIGLRGSVRRAA
jgi:hypothetical protein